MSILKTVRGYRQVATNVGDTPRSIALRELGDAARWTDIVGLNKLVPPYLVDDLASAGPGVLLAGQQTLKVPASPPPASGVTDAQSVFGTDIRLARGRLEATAGGDLLTVSGVPNLAQALTNRLATHTGELAYHPRYGCEVYRLIGQGGTATADRLAEVLVSRAVRSDPRIARVSQASATIGGDVIRASVTAITVDGKRIAASLPGLSPLASPLPSAG